jgi:DNA-binding response OmpR family regulator
VRPTRRRLLCVDDDADTNEILARLLNAENYEILTVESVNDALEVAQRESFNLYVLDHWFNRGSGVELCRKIREFDRHTPIIFYTGASFDSDREEAMFVGATAFISKPGIDELINTVHELLSDRQSVEKA